MKVFRCTCCLALLTVRFIGDKIQSFDHTATVVWTLGSITGACSAGLPFASLALEEWCDTVDVVRSQFPILYFISSGGDP